MKTPHIHAGLERLAKPAWPLIRLVQFLFLTGPFSAVSEVVAELNEPIETSVRYEEPAKTLTSYLDLLGEFERLKAPAPASYAILDGSGNPLPQMEAIELWVAQQVVVRELDAINSLLCGPCRCTRCCIGPCHELRQLFFEIPLAPTETDLFPLPKIDTPETRQLTSNSEPPLQVEGRPFYDQGAAIYRWRSGWSMILPRNATCPHLLPSPACAIYSARPEVCHRPPIFAYVIDRADEAAGATRCSSVPAFRPQRKILAIWDCPCIKRFQHEIAAYAQLCELEPIFMENKH